MQCSQLAIKQVQEQRVLDLIGEKDEILFIFDAMFMDYALINYHIHSEEFKATIARHGLPTDKTLQSHIQGIVDKLHEINEKF